MAYNISTLILCTLILFHTLHVAVSLQFFSVIQSKLSCWPSEFKCNNESKCIQPNLVCDGTPQCQDNSDELNCPNATTPVPCTLNEFRCTDGACIPIDWYCDGKNDCPDFTDESSDCLQNKKKCDVNEFLCNNHRCIPKVFQCDGENDCTDNSDEEHCPLNNHKINIATCTLAKRLYACKDELKCIDMKEVCDGIAHCHDKSDEGDDCHLAERNVKNCNCSHECVSTPDGAVCICPAGYELRHNVCEDINECDTYGICDQICTNFPGSYKCSCESDYYLLSDHRSCKATGPEGLLFYSTLDEIKAVYLNSFTNYTVANQVTHVTGVGSDGKYIYWTTIMEESPAIVRARQDGSQQEKICTSGLGTPEDLEVDWMTSNIYFTDAMMKQIGVCTNDGSVCTVLHNTDIDKPRAIALASQNGLMFWTDWGVKPLIARSNMDGSDCKTLASENVHWPNGITADVPSKRVYWIDAKIQKIETTRFDGTDRRSILQDSINHPFSIAVFDTQLYWSDWEGKEIIACNKLTGKDRRSIIREPTRKIFGIHVYHPILNRTKLTNPCAKANCSDICLVKPADALGNNSLSYRCACSDDKYLLEDGKTCRAVNLTQVLFVGYQKFLHLVSHEHVGHQKSTEVPLGDTIQFITALAYDSISDRIFISDSARQKIYAYDLNSLSLSPLTQNRLGMVSEMEFDDYGNNLYWYNVEKMSVEALSLTTMKQTSIVESTIKAIPIAFTLVPENGIMFVALANSFSQVHVDIISMVGSVVGRKRTEINIMGQEVSLHYCRSLKRIFWADALSGRIGSVTQEGTDRQIFTHTEAPVSLTSLHGEIFWIKKGVQNIYWKYDNEERSIKLDIQNYNGNGNVKISAIKQFDLKSDYPCLRNNGRCSDLCIPSVVPNKQMCACPNELSLAADRLDCTLPRACTDREYRCSTGECIPLINLCNKQDDCLRGDDELPDKCDTAACPIGQFLCSDKKKCIDHTLVCNGHYDCIDRSDEVCHVICSSGKFLCNSGECIDKQLRCNGKPDCPTGEDEFNCTSVSCLENEFRCQSGQCISKMFECDGDSDCSDGTDEYSACQKRASNKCTSKEFRCSNERCVDVSVTCDGRDDCGDNSDEGEHCSGSSAVDRFRLPNVFYSQPIMDGDTAIHKQCNPSKEFQCNSHGTYCLPISVKCNGRVDCPNGEDELDCMFSTCPHSHEFQCLTTKQCIPREWLCDRVDDCTDKSDEDSHLCSNGYTNRTVIDDGKVCEGFRCLNGDCIVLSKVCDGNADCSDKSDEGGQCGESCKKAGCAHDCYETPTGPQCYCRDGFQFNANDSKTCHDIDECEMEICAQSCVNTKGSFYCDCFSPGYVLKADLISCKAVGMPMVYVILSDYSIYTISHDLQHFDRIYYAPNKPKINSIAVDTVGNYVYWSSSAGLLARFRLNDTNNMQYISELDNPTKIAIDWITGNIYYVEAGSKIVICNFNTQKCSKIYAVGKGRTVSAMAVDPLAGYIFWNEIKYTDSLMPISIIKRADCSGSNVYNLTAEIPTVVDNLAIDPFKSNLYFLNRYNKSLERVTYYGLEMFTVFEVSSETVTFEHFENNLFWSTDDNSGYPLRKCKVHGLPPRSCELIPIHTPSISDFDIYHENKYPIGNNSCRRTNCTHICVLNHMGPVCLCSNGNVVNPGQSCKPAKLINNSINSTKSKTGSMIFIAYIVIMFLITAGIVFVYYRFCKPKSTMFEKFHFHNITRGNNSIGENQSAVIQSSYPILVPGKHTYENPLMENISLYRNQQSNEKKDAKQTPVIVIESPAADCTSELDYTLGSLENYKAPLING